MVNLVKQTQETCSQEGALKSKQALFDRIKIMKNKDWSSVARRRYRRAEVYNASAEREIPSEYFILTATIG